MATGVKQVTQVKKETEAERAESQALSGRILSKAGHEQPNPAGSYQVGMWAQCRQTF